MAAPNYNYVEQSPAWVQAYTNALYAARSDIRDFIDVDNCNPIMIRCAWHDSGTYNHSVKEWPHCGGANGSIRFEQELDHGANAGLAKAVRYAKTFKEKYSILSWADILQMASAEAVHLAGGPVIPMRYGRLDTMVTEQCPKEGNLPDALPAGSAAQHLRDVFWRMSFNDRDIVALSGAHTLGRAFKNRSGTVENGPNNPTKYTQESHIARADKKTGVGMEGGKSWTGSWLKFDNSYFVGLFGKGEDELVAFPTDKTLTEDADFKPYAELYAKSEAAFFEDYAAAHAKLSELGSKFAVAGGIVLDPAQLRVQDYTKQLVGARGALRDFIADMNCNPIMVRLAWHDSGTYDHSVQQWPNCGGANGSIVYETELNHGANAGLVKAVGYLRAFKNNFSLLSWADLIQMASAQSVELCGGPKIPMRYGRVDVAAAENCPLEGNLPDGNAPFPGANKDDAAAHLRDIFHRMGFDDRDIVALSGAHTIGRAFKNRSGAVENGPTNPTSYTNADVIARGDGNAGIGMPGGKSWTKKWLAFDNSYFTGLYEQADKNLLVLGTDRALTEDPSFKPHTNLYAQSQPAFFRDYASVHSRLSELGSKFFCPGGILLPEAAKL